MMPKTIRSLFLWGAVGAVAAAVLAGIVLMGSPQEERQRRLDAHREKDLARLSNLIGTFWHRHERLPASLDELNSERGFSVPLRDPDGLRYEYRPLGEKRKYELCAQFARDSSQGPAHKSDEFWAHGAGRQCYPLTVREPRR